MSWDFTLHRRQDSRWRMESPHFHEEFELLLPLTCGGSLFIERRAYPLRRGLLFLLDAAAPHRSFSEDARGYGRYVLHLPAATLRAQGAGLLCDALGGGSRCFSLRPEDFSLCAALLAGMEGPGAPSPSDALLRRAALLRLLAFLCALWRGDPAPPPGNAPGPAVSAAISHIRAHLDARLTLDNLAARCFVSKSTLCHRFKAETGFSVGEYVTLCRVQRARALLRRGAGVQQAGEGAGFGDNAHFIRTFKRLTGLTPGQYAKNSRREAAQEGGDGLAGLDNGAV